MAVTGSFFYKLVTVLEYPRLAGEAGDDLADDLDSVRWLTWLRLESICGALVVTAVQAIAESTGSAVKRRAV